MFIQESSPVPTSTPLQEVSTTCDAVLLHKVDTITNVIGCSTNRFFIEALKHFIQAVESESYNSLPDVVLQGRKLRSLRKKEFARIRAKKGSQEKEIQGQVEFKLICERKLLEKTWDIAMSMGWGKSSLITIAVAHLLKLIECERTPLFPDSVFVARLYRS